MGKFVTRNARELHEPGDAAFVRTTAGIPDGPTRFDFTKADNRSGISTRDATEKAPAPQKATKSFGINGRLDSLEASLDTLLARLNVIVESRKFAVQKANSSGLNEGDTEDMFKAARAKGKRIGGW